MLSLVQFAGLNIFLVIADATFKVLEKVIHSFNENILFPLFENIAPEHKCSAIKIKVGRTNIHIGKFLLDILKLSTTVLIIYFMWRATKSYKGLRGQLQK